MVNSFRLIIRSIALLSAAVVIMFIYFAPLCSADECSPLQISLWPSIQLVSQDASVCGARLNLGWGKNTTVNGLDLGIANSAQSVKGIQLGGLNILSSKDQTESWGLQIAGINYTDIMQYTGVQIGIINFGSQAFIYNYKSDVPAVVKGIQLAVFNVGKDFNGLQIAYFGNGNVGDVAGMQIGLLANRARDVSGVQIGLFNGARDMRGAQGGFWNVARHVYGLQIGAINWCETLEGIQIGLVNIVSSRFPDKGLFFTPLINVGF